MPRSRRRLAALSLSCLAATFALAGDARAQANDMAVQAIPTPADLACGQTAHEVAVQLINLGTNPQANVPVQVIVSGDISATYNTVVPGPLFPFQTPIVTMGALNTYPGVNINVDAQVMLPNDEDTSNDSLSEARYLKPIDITANVVAGCPGDPATISVQPEPLSEFELYDAAEDGNLLGIGDTFVTPPLEQQTTFWLERINGIVNGGAADNTIGMGGPYSSFDDGVVFDVNTPIVLRAVHVYPTGAGLVQVTVRDELNNVIGTSPQYQVSLAEVDMKTRIPVEIAIPPGSDYKITAEGSLVALYRNYEGAVYPYSINNWVDLTGNGSPALSGYYYFFYDWQISQDVPVCSTERQPIEVSPDLTQCAADVVVDITGPDTALPGSTVEYVTTVTNNGPHTAYSAIVHVPPPQGFTQIEAEGDCTDSYPCALGHMAAGTSATVTATYTVDEDYDGVAEFQALANSGSIEANPGDEEATITTTVENTAGVGGGGGAGGAAASSSSISVSSSSTGGGAPSDDGGCDCRAAGSSGAYTSGSRSGTGAMALLLGGWLVMSTRRRRRRR